VEVTQLATKELEDLMRQAEAENNQTMFSLCNEILNIRSKFKGGVLEVTTLVSARTGKGMIQFEMGETRIQMSVEEAKQHAMVVIQAAMCAETDALLAQFLIEKVGLNTKQWQAAMHDFRSMRS